MIFVTVGTIRFDELVQEIDKAVEQGRICMEVVIQIANGLYEPSHCRCFRTAPDLEPYYAQANLVIGHGGTGTTLEVLERGLRLISVANPSMIDNHQHEFLEALESLGYVKYCRELTKLPEFINAVLLEQSAPAFRCRSLFAALVRDLGSV